MELHVHTIDAAGKSPGRLATIIAVLLRGKHKPNFELHKAKGDNVVVKNASKMKITGNKAAQKRFYKHTGYPGGPRSKTVQVVMEKNPEEVSRRAVAGLLPPTQLPTEQMERLKFE